jgi:hypothetical protein
MTVRKELREPEAKMGILPPEREKGRVPPPLRASLSLRNKGIWNHG